MMVAITIPMSVSVVSMVSCLAYLSGGLVWHVLAYLFSYWSAFLYWYFKWNLSRDWVADLSWFVMTSRWSRYYLWDWDAMGFWNWYTFWYFDMSWDLDWNISASALNFDVACWWSYSNWGWSNNWSYSNWGWTDYWDGTKTRQKEGFSISCFGISFGFRFWFRFWCTLSNNMCRYSSNWGTSKGKSSRSREWSSTESTESTKSSSECTCRSDKSLCWKRCGTKSNWCSELQLSLSESSI